MYLFYKKNDEISFIHPFAIKSYDKLTRKNLIRCELLNNDMYNLSLMNYNITEFDDVICINIYISELL
jgi:hypothetical protein